MRIRILFSVFIILAVSSGRSVASDARIIDIFIKERYSLLTTTARLEGAFTKEMEEAFMSGMPVVFTFYINLVRDRSLIWNKTENRIKVHKMVKYDSFAKEFNAIEIISDEVPDPGDFDALLADIKKSNGDTLYGNGSAAWKNMYRKRLVLKDMNALESWMELLRDIPLGDKNDFPEDAKYYVEIKAEMDTIKLMPPFNYIFFFVSFLNFDTDWEASSPFMIAREKPPLDRMLVRITK